MLEPATSAETISPIHQLILLIGGNLGDRESLICQASQMIDARIGVISRRSAIYETDAWGKTDQPAFLNQALTIQTRLSAEACLEVALEIELILDRRRIQKWGSRTMDIDLIAYDQVVMQTERLTLPHPLIAERNFVMYPLLEISPDWVHPATGQSISELLRRSCDPLQVFRRPS